MKPQLRAALTELSAAYDAYLGVVGEYTSPGSRGGIDDFIGLKSAKGRVETASYMVDKAFRPKHYAKMEARFGGSR